MWINFTLMSPQEYIVDFSEEIDARVLKSIWYAFNNKEWLSAFEKN